MPPESSQLSYQTTMPEYPDISYETYLSQYYPNSQTEFGKNILWINPYAPKYDTWANSRISQYDAKVSAYNTWLQTGAGKRASALSGQYNPSYFDTGSPSMSPLGYNQTGQESPFSDMARGVSGIFQFLQALQGFQLTSKQIQGQALQNAGQAAKNEAQNINNRFLERILNNKVLYGSNQARYMGFQSAWKRNELEQSLGRRFGIPQIDPKTGLISGQVLSYDGQDFNLMDADKGFSYQSSLADLDKVKAATHLIDMQADMAEWDSKAKQFYHETIQDLERQALEGKITLLGTQNEYLLSRKEWLDNQNKWADSINKARERAIREGLNIKIADEVLDYVQAFFRFVAAGRGVQ